MRELNEREKKFVLEYLKDGNGGNAAIRAGYSKRSSRQIAARLLTKDNVKASLANNFKKVEEKAIVDATYVLTGLKRVHERCLKPEPVMEFDRDSRDMVQKTDSSGNLVYEFDSAGANRSLELLGKHLKLFTDKTELSADASLAEILKANLRADAE